MKHLFVPYEIAFELKNKGYNEPCFGWIHESDTEVHVLYKHSSSPGYVVIPIYQQVIDWFRNQKIKIVENPQGGWNIYVEYDGKYTLNGEYWGIDEAIKNAINIL